MDREREREMSWRWKHAQLGALGGDFDIGTRGGERQTEMDRERWRERDG